VKRDGILTVNIGGDIDAPNGIELRWPGGRPAPQVTLDGVAWDDVDETGIRLPSGSHQVVARW